MNELLSATVIAEDPAAFMAGFGRVLAVFDQRTQDSGNVSWLVGTEDGDLFVKTAGRPDPSSGEPTSQEPQTQEPRTQEPQPQVPANDFAARCARLRTAAELARSCRHQALAPLRNVIESPAGPVLVYDRVPGELIGGTEGERARPDSAYQRFARLPDERLLAIFDQLLDLHGALTRAGWVAGDLYDGCLILDFATDRLSVIDLDEYRRGPGVNTMGRMFGSSRFMAPEEFELGAPIDERTTVFTLGRLVRHFGTRSTEQAARFCGNDASRQVIERATSTERDGRYADVGELLTAWRHAR